MRTGKQGAASHVHGSTPEGRCAWDALTRAIAERTKISTKGLGVRHRGHATAEVTGLRQVMQVEARLRLTGKDGTVTPAQPLSRELIVEVARAAIEANGVDKLSLRAVARQLEVTAPALYAYVSDKHDLIAAVATQYFDELAARFESIEADDPLEGIRALSRAYVDHALASPQLFRLLFRYPPAASGMEVPGVEGFAPATRTFEMALATTADAIEAGLLTVTDPVAASMTMWAAVHGVSEVLLMGFGLHDDAAAELIESVISTVLSGQVHGI